MMLRWIVRPPSLKSQVGTSDEPRLRPYETLGWIYFLSDQNRLLLCTLRAANRAGELDYAEAVVKSLAGLGLGLTLKGFPRLATYYHRRAEAIAARSGDAAGSNFAKLPWGFHLFVCGRWRESQEVLQDAQRGADRIGDLRMWSDASVQINEIWCETGDFAQALDLSEEMVERGRETAFRPAWRWGLMEQGKALRRTGRVEEAYTVLNEVFAMAIGDKDLVAAAIAAGELGMALIALARQDEARVMLVRVHQDIARKIPAFAICGVYVALAELALLGLAAGAVPPHEARHACREIRHLGRTLSMARPPTLRLEGHLALLSGQRQRAVRSWQGAAAEAKKLGANYELLLVQPELDKQ